MKRVFSLLLAALLLACLCLPAAAAEKDIVAEVTEKLAAAVREWRGELDLSDMGVHVSVLEAAVERLSNDPELFWYQSAAYSYYSSGQVTKVRFNYVDGVTPADAAKLDAAADAALQCVLPGMTPVQTALVLHDYLAVHAAYDRDNFEAGTVPGISYTAYGALVLGTAVCQGYTRAYQLLLGRCGIESVYVSSEAMDHGWALVCLEGVWYHVDVTWDDPIPDRPGRAMHSYFLLSDGAISSAARRHYGWKTEHECISAKFDGDMFWQDLSTPVLFTDADTCWILTEEGDYTDQTVSLLRRSWTTGDAEVAAAVRDYWPNWDQRGFYWTDAYAGLVLWDRRLLFNDKQNVYAYDPADAALETVFTYGGSEGHIYGLVNDGGTLYYVLNRDPNQPGTLQPMTAAAKYPEPRPTGQTAPAPGALPFTDVAPGDYFHDAVQWAFERNVTTGTTETTFSPADVCTRAQVVTFLWRAMGRPAPKSAKNPFADVPEGAYYRDAVLWAVEQELLKGTGTDPATGRALFSPGVECTYAHILTLLWRCSTGKDASSYGVWYSEALDWAAAKLLLADTAPGTDRASVSAPCPRCDVATYLWRALA